MIREWSPDFPLMVMEFWPGWFDHWGQPHKGLDIPGNRIITTSSITLKKWLVQRKPFMMHVNHAFSEVHEANNVVSF